MAAGASIAASIIPVVLAFFLGILEKLMSCKGGDAPSNKSLKDDLDAKLDDWFRRNPGADK